ncbi:MAG: hypothetical protein P1U63_01910 [Coxiellaceae bacterium]|nr:hypothetical protein [Coxiellaceae bacterium]
MKNKRITVITAAALLCAPLALFAAKAANVGHYGTPTGLLSANKTALVTAKSASNSPSLVLTNLSNHDVYFEIAGVTGNQPLTLFAQGSQQGSNVYVVDGDNDNVTWIYNDYGFTKPSFDEEPAVFQVKRDSYNNTYGTNYYITH